MKRILQATGLIFAVSLGAQAQDVTPKPQIVKFTAQARVRGDTLTQNKTSDTTLVLTTTLDREEKTANQRVSAQERKVTTILATKNGRVTEFQVAYEKVRASQTVTSGTPSAEPAVDLHRDRSPSGKTFRFLISKNAVQVFDQRGKLVKGDLAEALKATEVSRGQFSGWLPDAAEFLAKRQVALGETLQIDPKHAQAFIPNSSLLGSELRLQAKATLSSVEKVGGVARAVFEVTIELEGVPQFGRRSSVTGLTSKFVLKTRGRMTVGIDNMWVYQLSMAGDLQVELAVESDEFTMKAKGKGRSQQAIANLYGTTNLDLTKKKSFPR